jgi:hypothetical protein
MHAFLLSLSDGNYTVWKRPYLLNTNTLEVITVQNRAWNDAFGMRMHAELQLKPFRERRNRERGKPLERKMMMVVDNVGSHHTKEVLAAFEDAGWILKYLPPNMTRWLQPMDLVVNAVCKAALRRVRISSLLTYFTAWRKRADAAVSAMKEIPKFDPPKPAPQDGVKAMLDLMTSTFSTEKFRTSLQRVFRHVGLAKMPPSTPVGTANAPQSLSPYWMQYTARGRGSFKCDLDLTGDDDALTDRLIISTTDESILVDNLVRIRTPPNDLRGLEFSVGADLLPIVSRTEALDTDDCEEEKQQADGERDANVMGMTALMAALLYHSDDDGEDEDTDTTVISDITDNASYGTPDPNRQQSGARELEVVDDEVQHAGGKKAEPKLHFSVKARWLTITLETMDDEIKTSIINSLSSYDQFLAFCFAHAVLTLHIAEEIVHPNYTSIRPDGWCWYTLWTNLYLISKGRPQQTLRYELADDIALLSEAIDYYTTELLGSDNLNRIEQRIRQVTWYYIISLCSSILSSTRDSCGNRTRRDVLYINRMAIGPSPWVNV